MLDVTEVVIVSASLEGGKLRIRLQVPRDLPIPEGRVAIAVRLLGGSERIQRAVAWDG